MKMNEKIKWEVDGKGRGRGERGDELLFLPVRDST